ncbi:MAG: hypothetical protein JW751_18555 [Polyangiaceae bacterium]|nr:hypothetical protein [Polyangiaceae bacterium]
MNERDPFDRWLSERRSERPSFGFVDRVMSAIERDSTEPRSVSTPRRVRRLSVPIVLSAAALVLHVLLVVALALLVPGTAL